MNDFSNISLLTIPLSFISFAKLKNFFPLRIKYFPLIKFLPEDEDFKSLGFFLTNPNNFYVVILNLLLISL